MKKINLYITCTAFLAGFVIYTFTGFTTPSDKAHEPSVLTNALQLVDNSFTEIDEDKLILSDSSNKLINTFNKDETNIEEDEIVTVSALTEEELSMIEEESNHSNTISKFSLDENAEISKDTEKGENKKAKATAEDDAIETILSISNRACDDKDIAISIATSYVNIRKEANTDSEILGKLYSKNAAHILKTEGDWLYISSGNVEGYIKSEYVISGLTEEELAEYGTVEAKVTSDGLNVREEPSTEAKRVDVVYNGESYPVLQQKGDWFKIDIEDDGVKGYVLSDYIEVTMAFTEAISIAEENAIKKAEEEALKQAEAKKEASSSQASQKIETVYGNSTNYSNDELKLLAALVHAEAGNQSYEGKLAVANVVLNRVKSRKYPNSIYDVIYQKSQFSVASSGSLKKQLELYSNYNTKSQKLSIQAAKDAFNGINNVGSRLYFNRYSSKVSNAHSDNGIKIDDQFFW